MQKTCTVPGCERKQKACGLCSGHWKRMKRYGTPLGGGTIKGKPAQWLEQHRNFTGSECLVWPFAKGPGGYGVINRLDSKGKRRPIIVARIMCESRHGPQTSEFLEAAHSCGNGHLGCVNPMHVDWKSHRGNMADMVAHGRSTKGEKNRHAKLTASQVNRIRNDKVTAKKVLSARYGVHRGTIYSIQSNRLWREV